MNSVTHFAFDQPEAKPGCKYTKTVVIAGWEAGADEQCGPSYYVRQPSVYIPVVLIFVAVIVLVVLGRRKKAK